METEDGAITSPESDVSRDRAIRLFTFLRRLAELRTKTIRTLEEYEQVLWFHSIPQEKGCHCIAWRLPDAAQADVWVEIHKPRLQPPPALPKILEPWVYAQHVADSSQDMPEIQERIPAIEEAEKADDEASQETTILELANFPEVRSAWERYVMEIWWPWAEKDRLLQQVQRCYTSLYSLYQRQQRLGEAHEVVLGLGYLTWRTPRAQTVKRHLLVAQTSIQFDAAKGKITVGPGAEGAKPVLEEDMLEASECPDPNESRAIAKIIEDTGDAIWSDGGVGSILQAWLNAFPKGKGYNDSLIPQESVLPEPQVRLAPALILRKRTERSFVRVFKEICEQLHKPNNPVPGGVHDIVDDPDSTKPVYGYPADGPESSSPTDTEIYFPLIANSEQVQIARQVASSRGVLVQGPPGTGKSHTIANLVCHLLAKGKRVLVTSHTARALQVLRGKFPKEIAPLCVVALGEDPQSVAALEESVHGIATRFSNWRRADSEQRVTRYQESLDQSRRTEAKLLLDLRSIREAETLKYPPCFGDYEGTLQQIAQRLRREESCYAWVGAVSDEAQDTPLQNAEALELLTLMRQIDADAKAELGLTIVTPEAVPTPDGFTVLVNEELDARRRYEAAADARNHPAYEQLRIASADDRACLISSLKTLCSAFNEVSQDIQVWMRDAALQILAGQSQTWQQLHDLTIQHLQAIDERATRVFELSVVGTDSRDKVALKAHALSLYRHFQSGGGLGFLVFRPKPVKEAMYLIKEVRVGGRLCNAPQPLSELINWLAVREHLDSLDEQWKALAKPSGNTLIIRKAWYEDLASKLTACLTLRDRFMTAKAALHSVAGLTEPPWHDIAALKRLIVVAEAVTDEEQLNAATDMIDDIAKLIESFALKPDPHPVLARLADAVCGRRHDIYAEGYRKLETLARLREKQRKKDELLSRLSDLAPDLSAQLTATYEDATWDERMASFSAAWNWARASNWAKRLADPLEHQRLARSLKEERARIHSILAGLASELAWQHCHSRLTRHTIAHLKAWQMAVKRIRRGTGKYANRYRREAQDSLEQCRTAIPAWIMPMYRVTETVRIRPDIFDVVIIDEASQSGPEALFLQYIAKAVVVVGDEKQISPEFVGQDKQEVALLRSQHVADLPFSDSLGVDHSFFDHAFIRYVGHIRLREHFRCMPEIIQFSNNLCYSTAPLIPLKQFGAGRIYPTVSAIYLPDGYQKGQSPRIINPPEARAIAERIKECCSDPRYAGKTMGVISLLGKEQARLIQSLLLSDIGPEEMEKRGIICGNAYAFQGDERDVMFLSLVSAPGGEHRIGTLSASTHEQRFNVAASRAREQMFLFHSVTLNDLSKACLRYRLLEYCLHPAVQQSQVGQTSISQLRTRAADARRDLEKPPHPFDTWFEVDVFLRIVDRGYRVLPQFEVAGYRIDLLVEGIHGRLAVECDGDQWHGPERWDEDDFRQRQLERSGYVFWRVRGSVFYLDPDSALDSLWQLLRRMRISPDGVEDAQQAEQVEVPIPVSLVDGPLREPSGQSTRPLPLESEEAQPTEADGDRDLGHESADESHHDLPTPEESLPIPPAPPSTSTTPKTEETPIIDPIPLGVDNQPDANALRSLLSEYRPWVSHSLPDPRVASLDQVSKGLVEIVTAEGPMLCYRAYRLYVAAAGIGRIGRQIRSVFNRAMHRAVRAGVLQEADEFNMRDQMHRVVRVAGSSSVSLRQRADRTIEEIPPSELAQLMDEAVRMCPSLTHARSEDLFRFVLDVYELVRLTSNAKKALTRAWEIHKPRS